MSTTSVTDTQRGDECTHPRHPLGTRAKVLLTSVFGPYAQDDEFGSRTINPMELYHNQVTRVQGPFSLRMFHGSWGLEFILANIEAPCTMLDFPTRERFIDEISRNYYDIIGISSIMVNLLKVREMCRLIRKYQPKATIVIGGHIANVADLDSEIDADHIVRGEGVQWFCRFLGQEVPTLYRHPLIVSGFGARSLGIKGQEKTGEVAATLIPSVGCPMGCDFCSTSAMFGGKGKCFHFYESGEQLFDIMCQLEEALQVQSFFVMDENFLLNRKRALRLLELMEQNDKAWTLYVFSSAHALRLYTIDQLVRLGISWVWMGLEGKDSEYSKLHGIDTFELVSELQSHGIHVLGSTIIGLDSHTPENIADVIEWAVRHNTDFHQFMLHTAIYGTPLHAKMSEMGLLKDRKHLPIADMHGQDRFNHWHPHIHDGVEADLLLQAFQSDFEVNGPSLVRITRTSLAGWKRYRRHPDLRVRRRHAQEAKQLPTQFAAIVWACKKYYRRRKFVMHHKMSEVLLDLRRNFGFKSWFFSTVGGRYVYWMMKREQRRLARGWTYEPPMFLKRNFGPLRKRCRWVTPRVLTA